MSEFIFQVKIKANIDYDPQANVFVAHVPALNIYSQAEKSSEAELAIIDAVESYLKVSHETSGK
ncbi:hypothetical protein ES703_98775 [subsurface metagenome]